MKSSIVFVLAFFKILSTNAQKSFLDSVKRCYPFIDTSSVEIRYSSPGLSNFYNVLFLQEQDKNQVINVSHIGDSHIQADFFSGKLRRNLQKRFGNAGRGLVFPYKLAKTNEPWGLHSEGSGVWEAKRCVFYENPLPIGVSGITLKCTDSLSDVALWVEDQEGLDYRFNKFTLFHQKGPDCYDLLVQDALGNLRGFINSNLQKPHLFLSEVYLDSLTHYVKLKSYKRDSSQQHITQIYGLYLENGSAGILYNTIGVNGAEYPHFNKAILFQEQIKYLNNRLVIISLGTNDLINSNPDFDKLISEVDTMIKSIRFNNPHTSILITGPGDFFRKKKFKNKDVEIFNQKLDLYCRQNNLAFWNWYAVMGGLGSVLKFQKKGLAQPDKIHLTRAGYELQGNLLYYALMEGYQKFKQQRP